jgi:hypothetical protein
MPFYVGKGTVKNRRANVSSSKPEAWKEIASISGFRPRIIKYFESNDEALAFEAEIQPIYASIGIQLVNQLKCGGNSGPLGQKHSKESIQKISEASKKAWSNPEFHEKVSEKSKGLKNPFADHRVHSFWHKDHGFINETNYGLRSKYKTSESHLSDVINGKRFETHGWRLAKNANKLKPSIDSRVLKWIHPIHGERNCIKVDLMKEFPELDQGTLCHMIAGRIKSTKGWKLFPSIKEIQVINP